jgi:O-antigen/teichoic acid export membrane protein
LHKFFYLSERILRTAQAFLTSIIAARILTIEEFSSFVYAQIFLFLLIPLALFGIESNFIRRYFKGNKMLWASSATLVICFSSSISALVLYTLISLGTVGTTEAFFFCLVLISLPAYVFNYINQAEEKFYKNFTVYLCSFCITTIIKAITFFNEEIQISIFLIATLDYLVPSLIQMIMNYKLIYKQYLFISIKQIVRIKLIANILIRDSYPLLLSSFVVIIFMKVDQFMVSWLHTDHELAILAVSSKLNEGLLLIPAVLSGVAFPRMLKLYNADQNSYEQFVKKICKNAIFLNIVVYALILLCSKYIVELVYGLKYSSSADILYIQSMTILLTFFGMISAKICVIHNFQRMVLLSNLLGLILNIIMNLILIPEFGAKGAAISTVLTQLVTSYLFWHLHPKVSGVCKIARCF